MVNPFQNKDLSPNIIEKQFREACQALSVESSLSRDASSFKVDYVGNPKDVEKILQRTISEFSYLIIFWVSDNGIPDLGGDIEEETCYSDEVNQPVLTYPGAYRKVTVELKDATSCPPTFRVLKQLIQRCLADAVSSGNIFADVM
ncbi:hypothetical protein L1887_27697 [Cichorium endivia]|nr:hypothetical protein L1887_27697 [Cichorium endivia]